MTENRSAVTIQKHIRGKLCRNNAYKHVIKLFNRNPNEMIDCFSKIIQILKQFPPAKNENKFIYGKCIERIVIECINKLISCTDLDSIHTYSSEYRNDCKINCLHIYYSIKASKSGGKVTIINKNNIQEHSINSMCFIICHIEHKRLYVFRHSQDFDGYVCNNGASIDYKASIFTYLRRHPEYYYEFPNSEVYNGWGHLEERDIYQEIVDTLE